MVAVVVNFMLCIVVGTNNHDLAAGGNNQQKAGGIIPPQFIHLLIKLMDHDAPVIYNVINLLQ